MTYTLKVFHPQFPPHFLDPFSFRQWNDVSLRDTLMQNQLRSPTTGQVLPTQSQKIIISNSKVAVPRGSAVREDHPCLLNVVRSGMSVLPSVKGGAEM